MKPLVDVKRRRELSELQALPLEEKMSISGELIARGPGAILHIAGAEGETK